MDSTTKDELKIKIPQNMLRTPKEIWSEKQKIDNEITNYDQMLKEFIEFVDEYCESILDNLRTQSHLLAAYNVGMLHKEAINAIEQFGIGHLFENEVEK